jgi:hypothetical protein
MKRPTLKGPELKLPELKAPDFLADLYYDLRDRRLLPFVALVVVAIAAVPFLLGGSAEEPVLSAPAGAAALESSEGASHLTVVEATPGLRDYRKRLRHLRPSDPFVQQYTESATGSASSSSAEGSSASTEDSSSAAEVETGGSSGGGGGSGASGGGAPSGSGGGGANAPGQGAQLIQFVFDIQISHTVPTADGGRKMSEPEVRHHVKSLTQLPGEKLPLVTVAGLNLHNGNVWFLVSDEVSALDGDFTCVTRTPTGICELLEIKPGFPLELTYGPEKDLYRLKVTGIDTVSADKVGDGSRSTDAAFDPTGDLSLPRP